MVANGEFTIADVKRVLRKHWWILPVCALGLGTLSVLVVSQLPKEYTSQTLVLVAKPAVPADYVKPVVTEDLRQRLASMKEQILSRTRLEPIIQKFNLYAKDRAKLHMEDSVDRLRKTIAIAPLEAMPGTEDQNIPGFSVGVTFSDPQLAQQICTEITSMFMEQNGQALEQQANRTNSFIGEQLDQAKAKLDEQDAKLAQFKREHIGFLPEEEQSNLSLLATLNSELDATSQALTRAQQDKAFNETLLGQQEASWKADQSTQNPETLQDQLRTRQEQLTVLESRDTPEHPDVVKLKSEIDELKKKIAQTPAPDDPSLKLRQTTEPPQIQQLRARIHQGDLAFADLTKHQAKVQEQIRVLQGRIQSSPIVELQLKELSRNYQTALDFYNDLLRKGQNSAMARDLVRQQEGEQFRVLDPPSLPTSPSFPNRLKFVGGGLGGGLALGLAILYLIMVTDKTLHTEKDVEIALKIPVLAVIPLLEVSGLSKARASKGFPKPSEIAGN